MSAINCDTLACRSSVIATGTLGPTISLTRRASSPSMSGYSSDTAAPIWFISIASNGPWARSMSKASPPIVSNTCLLMVPAGSVAAKINGTRSKLCFSEACMKPAIDVWADLCML